MNPDPTQKKPATRRRAGRAGTCVLAIVTSLGVALDPARASFSTGTIFRLSEREPVAAIQAALTFTF